MDSKNINRQEVMVTTHYSTLCIVVIYINNWEEIKPLDWIDKTYWFSNGMTVVICDRGSTQSNQLIIGLFIPYTLEK